MQMSEISNRLREERKRLGLNQTQLAEFGGVQLGSQSNYEKGERSPTVEYLKGIATAGADILYIVTGQRQHPNTLNAEYTQLIDQYRKVKPKDQAAISCLLASLASANQNKK